MKAQNYLEVAGDTDPGCVRPNNEDSFTIDEEIGLYLVADGMGGHNSGEVASGLAASEIRSFARQLMAGGKNVLPEGGDPTQTVRERQLVYCVKSVNTLIYEKGRAFPKDAGMGTTVVAALADAKSITVAHVGDSRLYLFRRGKLDQLTEDHSLVGDQVRRGLITPDEASRSNLQNVLTRAVGAEADVKVDAATHPLLPGDVVILASDGLTKMMKDSEIEAVIAEDGTPKKIVSRLIEKSRAAGGHDNITIVALRVATKEAGGGLKGMVSKLLGS
jgi:protein phosphatase